MKKVMTFMVGDLFHVGHLRLLERAMELGDFLVVGVASDHAVEVQPRKKLKTVVESENRLRVIQSIKGVDFAFIYANNIDLERSIEAIHPDVICRGDDWPDFPGKEKAMELGIEIVYLPYTQGISSTDIKRRCYEEFVRNGESLGTSESAGVPGGVIFTGSGDASVRDKR